MCDAIFQDSKDRKKHTASEHIKPKDQELKKHLKSARSETIVNKNCKAIVSI
jgi:uncharacterized C2H2 Zn-finger protein